MTDYAGNERRKFPRSMEDIEHAFERKLKEHEERERDLVKEEIAALKEEAFPDGASAHKLAHQAMIDAANAEQEFWQSLKKEVISKSIWGILRILGILIFAGLLAKAGLWPAYTAWLGK